MSWRTCSFHGTTALRNNGGEPEAICHGAVVVCRRESGPELIRDSPRMEGNRLPIERLAVETELIDGAAEIKILVRACVDTVEKVTVPFARPVRRRSGQPASRLCSRTHRHSS